MRDVLKKELKVLNIDKKTINKLNDNDIETVISLCSLNRKKLKECGLDTEEINSVIVKLQLQGLDLGKKYKIKQ